MKPRNKFEKLVAASNKELTAIGSKAVEWAVRNVVKHIGSEHRNINARVAIAEKSSTIREKASLSVAFIADTVCT